MEIIKIDISSEMQRFEDHLSLPNNQRIIFSGIFGIGKTYFLKEFFLKYQEKYEVIYLSPVNYIVSQNEDIFEYIKTDIVFNLLEKKDVSLEKIGFSIFEKVPAFVQLNLSEIFSILVKNASKIQKEISSIYDSLIILKKKFDEFEKTIQVDEENELVNYLKEISDKKGSIFEENRISQLITKIIENFNERKQTVLIVDDLDRIDPEHLFRIFNIFSCHLNFMESGTNKFSMNKIIFVGDVENFKNIYHNKYGIDVDFNGYIDKFYTYETFNFNNKSIVDKNIHIILNSIQFPQTFPNNDWLIYILNGMLFADAMNLRTLLRFPFKQWTNRSYNIHFEERKIRNWHIEIVFVFDFLFSLFGTLNAVRVAIEKCILKAPNLKLNADNYPIGFLILLADIENHKLQAGLKNYSDKKLNLFIEYNIKQNLSGRPYFCDITKASYYENQQLSLEYFPFFTFLKIAFDRYTSFRNSY
jgi:hypothetical protein